jgi:hypothetical protein
MVSTHGPAVRHRIPAVSIAAGVALVFVLAGVEPAGAQAPPPDTCRPRQVVDFCTAVPSDLPRGRGFLLDKKGECRTFQFSGAVVTAIFDIDNRGQMTGVFINAQESSTRSRETGKAS